MRSVKPVVAAAAGISLAGPSLAVGAGQPPVPSALRASFAGATSAGAELRLAAREIERRRRLVDGYSRLWRRLGVKDRTPALVPPATARSWSDGRLRAQTARLRHRLAAAQAAGAIPPILARIARCESGGDPRATSGAFRGKYQFDAATWASVGGRGDPAAAPVGEQDRRAAILLARSGTSPWPVCGR